MKIDCSECGARILAEDLDLPTSMAKCRDCNAVFSFADRLPAPPAPQRERLRAPRPEGLQVHETAITPSEPGYRDAPSKQESITVVRRWFSPIFIVLGVFCCIWDGFLVFWYLNLIVSPPSTFSIVAGLFPILHVCAGVGLTYWTIAGFFNRTTLRLDEQNLSVRHGPVPWKGNCTIAREDIKQLYCEHQVTRGKNGPSHSYHLSAVLVDGRKVRLSEMPLDHAKYIEDLFEERLGITDMRVPGEVGANGN